MTHMAQASQLAAGGVGPVASTRLPNTQVGALGRPGPRRPCWASPAALSRSSPFAGRLDQQGQQRVQPEEGLAVPLLQQGGEQPLRLLAQDGQRLRRAFRGPSPAIAAARRTLRPARRGRAAGEERARLPLYLGCLALLPDEPAAFREGMRRRRSSDWPRVGRVR
jgi:hypothetical protein